MPRGCLCAGNDETLQRQKVLQSRNQRSDALRHKTTDRTDFSQHETVVIFVFPSLLWCCCWRVQACPLFTGVLHAKSASLNRRMSPSLRTRSNSAFAVIACPRFTNIETESSVKLRTAFLLSFASSCLCRTLRHCGIKSCRRQSWQNHRCFTFC